jgi:S-adenosylmethionine:tRNA ribosyltransferase-isomerase
MKTDVLDYNLPPELIAQAPAAVRSDSRLLVVKRASGELIDSRFKRIGDFLMPGDCLVLNDTKVLQGRFFAGSTGGAKLQGLLLTESSPGFWQVLIKGLRKIKVGETIYLADRQGSPFCDAEVLEKSAEGKCSLKLKTDADLETILAKIGFAPLPPYIKRTNDAAKDEADRSRYQTVYARKAGAVAAPTAGLHFTNKLLDELAEGGVRLAYVTLHVGAGTFRPVKTETLEEHKIHQERFTIDEENARIINQARKNRGRIIAVGTTTVRTLETATDDSGIRPASGETELFIMPGYDFKAVDAMITNFHLPRSTLLALVAAFAGLENIMAAYRHAIEQRYRFYSYGDAMLIS